MAMVSLRDVLALHDASSMSLLDVLHLIAWSARMSRDDDPAKTMAAFHDDSPRYYEATER